MSGNLPRARPALLLPLLLLSAERADSGILGGYELEEEQPVTASEKNLERRLKRRGEAAWKIPLGAALVEDLRWLDGDRIYVSLRLDSAGLENLDHFVVEAGTGAEVWRRARKDDERYSLVHADDAVMLFAIDRRKGDRRLIALGSDTGEPVWALSLKKPTNGHHLPPAVVAGGATIAVVDPRRRLVTALRLATGEELWRRRLAKTASPAAALISDGRSLWDPNGRLQAVSLADGRSLWPEGVSREIRHDAPPQIDGGQLFAIDADGRAIALDAGTGELAWRLAPGEPLSVTNLYPYDDRLYLRGTAPPGSGDPTRPHRLVAVERANGSVLWRHATSDPSLSNLIHADGFAFHATGTEVFKLDAATGAPVFATRITDTGRSYPVRLRAYENHIAYIGELVIAGVDPDTGELRFSHGLSPVSPETSLNALDVSIPRLRERLGATESGPGGVLGLGEAGRYQNMANSYHRQAQSYRSQAAMARSAGSDSMADSAEFRALEAQGRANRASNQARTMATIEMSMAVMNLAMQLREAWRLAGIKAAVDRQVLFRNSILASYAAAESYEYVYRPHQRYRSPDDQFVGVDVVHLPTGRHKFNYLSPAYRSYGLWNLVDLERGRVIHHGVGLEPADYEYSEPRRPAALAPKIRTVKSFLIAAPLRLP